MIYRKVIKNTPRIRVWSAGCSSGEEPYSIAIILRELLGEEYDSFTISIVGSDIDEECLMAAREGRYLPRQVVNVPKPYLEKYFSFDGQMYQVCPEIMDMVEFKNVDLFSSTAGTGYDVILCRNVVIYFTKDMQERLYMKFYKALNPDGYFIMGNTETLVGEATRHLTSIKSRERVYQKIVT
jgi:chemotaxis protein methyltransferase CheR